MGSSPKPGSPANQNRCGPQPFNLCSGGPVPGPPAASRHGARDETPHRLGTVRPGPGRYRKATLAEPFKPSRRAHPRGEVHRLPAARVRATVGYSLHVTSPDAAVASRHRAPARQRQRNLPRRLSTSCCPRLQSPTRRGTRQAEQPSPAAAAGRSPEPTTLPRQPIMSQFCDADRRQALITNMTQSRQADSGLGQALGPAGYLRQDCRQRINMLSLA
jgi:hypothetical protein